MARPERFDLPVPQSIQWLGGECAKLLAHSLIVPSRTLATSALQNDPRGFGKY